MTPIKIALAQMDVHSNMPERNLETMLRMVKDARVEGVDLIAFPEMCIPGYLLGDKWCEDATCTDFMTFNQNVLDASDGIAAAYGNIFLDDEISNRVGDDKPHPNKDGRTRKYNAIYVVQNGEAAIKLTETKILPIGMQPKTLLPNYRFFDDERYFFSLEDVAKDFGVPLESLLQPFLIETKNGVIPIGFELCEDLWCADYRRNGEALNPTKILIENGAQFIVNLSASPWTYEKNHARDRRVKFLKEESGERFVPFFYVNCTGVQNNGKNIITFDGGSTAYNADGKPIVLSSAPYKRELIVVDEMDLEKPPVEREERPKIEQKYQTLIEGIRHMTDMAGLSENPRFLVGMSGGIDSSVVAALLVQAVGKDSVVGVNMPTRINSPATKYAAFSVAKNLGISYVEIPIEGIVKEIETSLLKTRLYGEDRPLRDIVLENIQAKIRATDVLSNYAQEYEALFTNNGNKLEVALGYATLYGDWGGALSILGDLTKTEIYEMAGFLNKEVYGFELIPKILIPDRLFRFQKGQIKPSAELKSNQIDPMKFGYHCALIEAFTNYMKRTPEDVMKWYLEGTLEENLGVSYALLKRWGVHNPEEFIRDLEWFHRKVSDNVFKRVQSPPIIVTSKSAYGYDIRESVLPYRTTKEHERLKQEVLSMGTYKPK